MSIQSGVKIGNWKGVMIQWLESSAMALRFFFLTICRGALVYTQLPRLYPGIVNWISMNLYIVYLKTLSISQII